MKVSYEWLKELVNINEDPNDTAHVITMSGLEVEKLITTGIGNVNVVVVELLSVEKHPDADKLFITQVDAGKFGKKQIVTNVKGLEAGMKVLAALEGVKLSNGMEIKRAKLKGVESEGMFTGWEELGIDQKSEGLLYLDKSINNGTNYNEVLPFNDVIIDIELTANRGDCLGMIGVAREIETLYDKKIKQIETDYNTVEKKAEDIFSVEIKTKNCHRYCGGVILDVKIEPSPYWMQLKLIKSGIRPINNIVDITNYVLMECNQPLHAFDMDKISDKKIIVRDALKGEKLITLDDIERKLEEDDIVIADTKTGHCMGGIMGGQISEVCDDTKNIFLEAAFFKPEIIRKTSKRTGLRSESSYRFERAIDIYNVDWALRRALYLFDKLKVGKVCEGIIDIYPAKKEKRVLNIDFNWINGKLGTELNIDDMKKILVKLGFEVKINSNDLNITIPGWRNDVAIKEDIAEEIARIYGYNNIKKTHFPAFQAAARTLKQKKEREIRNLLQKLGCDQVMNFSFYGKSLFDKMMLSDDHSFRNIINLGVPLTDDWAGIRNSLIPGMIKTASFNITHKINSISLFEIGNVSIKSKKELPDEEKHIGIVLGGNKRNKDYTSMEVKYDYYDIKGIIDYIFDYYKIKPDFIESNETYLHPYQQAKIIMNNTEIGVFGKLHPVICDSFNMDIDAYVAEINLEEIFKITDEDIVYKEVPKYPSSTRDLALIVNKSVKSEDILNTIKETDVDILQKAKIFDIYSGENIEAGKYSIAVTLTFNKIISTLKDNEVDEAVNKILSKLEQNQGAKIR